MRTEANVISEVEKETAEIKASVLHLLSNIQNGDYDQADNSIKQAISATTFLKQNLKSLQRIINR